MLRATRPLLAALQPLKTSTGITGLAVHPDPLPALKQTYSSTLSMLSSLPQTSVYRQATEAITQHRLQLVESSGQDASKVEKELGTQVELVLQEAQDEQQLVGNMIEWKGWEELEHKPVPNQWRYFDPANPDEL